MIQLIGIEAVSFGPVDVEFRHHLEIPEPTNTILLTNNKFAIHGFIYWIELQSFLRSIFSIIFIRKTSNCVFLQ